MLIDTQIHTLAVDPTTRKMYLLFQNDKDVWLVENLAPYGMPTERYTHTCDLLACIVNPDGSDNFHSARHVDSFSFAQYFRSQLPQDSAIEESEAEETLSYVCADCGDTEEYEEDDDTYTNTDGERICESCDESYYSCENCYERLHSDDIHAYNDSVYCDSCLDNISFECHDCNRRTDSGNRYLDNRDNDICERCYERNYFTCEACNTTQHNDTYGGDGRCDDCYERPSDDEGDDTDDETELVHNYGHKPYTIFHGTGIHYGVELEVNSTATAAHAGYTLQALNGTVSTNSYNQKHAYLKRDGSLSNGFEIVTHPHTFVEHKKLWHDFFAAVPKGMTSYKSGECGMHVHIERSKLSKMQIRRMVYFLNCLNARAYVETIAQRSNNTYARLEEKELCCKPSYVRYEALNLNNSHTVELRIFRGSVRADRFYKNLEFTDALVHFCGETTYSKLTVENFLAYVTKRKSTYKHLYNYHLEKSLIVGRLLTITYQQQRELFPAACNDMAA